jgi:ABC transporter fused permease/ATP-binding protein
VARFRRLLSYLRPYRVRFWIALVALVIGALLALLPPFLLGKATDVAVTVKSTEELNQWTLILVGVILVQAVFVIIRHFLMSWLGERVVADLRVEVYGHLMRMPVPFFRANRTGEILSRLADDVTKLQSVIGQDISILLRSSLSLVVTIAYLAYRNPMLTGAMLLSVPAFVLITVLWSRVIRRLSKQAQDELATASGDLQEAIGAIDIVQAFTRESFEVDRYVAAIRRVFRLFVKRIWARSWFMGSTSFFAFSLLAGIFWMGGSMVARGEMTVGELLAFLMYTAGIAANLGSMSDMFSRYAQALGSSERVFEILDTVPSIRDADDALGLDAPRGEVAFRGVTFAYTQEDEPVIRELDLEIHRGEVVALCGPSGSGKTTVSRLLLRSWDPQLGTVSVDGHDLRTLTLDSLRGAMAVVSQDPILFSGTVRENIRYGRLEATDEEVEAAARAANADTFIREFPDGYEMLIGERGVTLSGGQRQRVAIARALLRDPAILILDEATSALDGESEHLVQQALETLQKGRTTLVIAHRLSTIRDADRIVVLDHGKIVEQGRHEELLGMGGTYARLVAHQARDEARLLEGSEVASEAPASAE